MLCQDLLIAPWSQQQQRYNRERPRLLCSPEYPDTSPTAPSTQQDRDEAKYTERDHDNMKPQDRFSDIDAEGRGLHGGFDQCTLRPRGLAARASEASASLRHCAASLRIVSWSSAFAGPSDSAMLSHLSALSRHSCGEPVGLCRPLNAANGIEMVEAILSQVHKRLPAGGNRDSNPRSLLLDYRGGEVERRESSISS